MAEDSVSAPDTETREAPQPQQPATEGSTRRNLLVECAALLIGGIVTLTPLIVGIPMLLDPVLRRRQSKEGGSDAAGDYVRVATLDSIPDDGAPQQFPVIADQHDAWNFFPNQRIGSVFLRRSGPKEVTAFNAVCPHLGCLVTYVDSREVFHCPCHNSAFHVDGSKIDVPGRNNPSPRPLDTLEVDQQRLAETGEVWVKFQNFYTGKEEKKPKT